MYVVFVGSVRSNRVIRFFSRVEEVLDHSFTLNPSMSHFIPFAIPVDRINGAEQGDSVIVYENVNLAPGCKGLINVGHFAPRTPDLLECIRNGYNGTVVWENPDSTTMIPANPGFRGGALSDAVDELVGTTVSAPVFDVVTGQGNNTTFNVIGLGHFTITENTLGGGPHGGQIVASFGGFSGAEELKYSACDAVEAVVTDSGRSIVIEGWQEVSE